MNLNKKFWESLAYPAPDYDRFSRRIPIIALLSNKTNLQLEKEAEAIINDLIEKDVEKIYFHRRIIPYRFEMAERLKQGKVDFINSDDAGRSQDNRYIEGVSAVYREAQKRTGKRKNHVSRTDAVSYVDKNFPELEGTSRKKMIDNIRSGAYQKCNPPKRKKHPWKNS